MSGLSLRALAPCVLILSIGQWGRCQLLPDLSDPCASSATQLHDNDIAFFPSHLVRDEPPSDSEEETRRRRGATSERLKLWPDGVVHYIISGRFTEADKRTIREAMKHWEDNTCIRFKQRTNQHHYVRFFPGSGCCSYVGRIHYGRQPQGVSFSHSCFSFHVVVHEIGHVLGFWHEQSRPDRDQYIDIFHRNILAGYENNFRKVPTSLIDSLGVGYDYNSIMHYDSNFFSRHPSLDTLRAKDPSIPVGGAVVLSQLDILQANLLYSCNASNLPPPSIVLPPLATPPPFPSVPFSCVYHLTSLEGSLRSRGYPFFRHNEDCVWLIKVSDGYKIQLTFEPIELENTFGCTKDFIKVYDNFQLSGNPQTFCAFYNTYHYTVHQGGSALVHYHTDSGNDLSRTRTPIAGFQATYRVIDIDECVHADCSHGCRNLPGSYECTCPRGFFLSANGFQCFDMNECGVGNGGCEHECINTGGSFRCDCRGNYELQPDRHSCRLPGTSCSQYNGGCHHVCTQTPTSKICSCNQGYKLHSDGHSCIDDNECYLQRSGCQHRCTNTRGSYVCSCRDGFRLSSDEHTCLPERTCSVDNGGCGQLCRDTNRGVTCSCKRGYRLSVDQRSCEDVDECVVNRRTCQDLCINTNGSYYCSCSDGLRLNTDHRTCADIDECLTGDNECPFKDLCVNYRGFYRCSCPTGYHSRPDGLGCDDVDECALGFSAYCSHTCHNLPGSFECGCPPGHTLQDSYTCGDVDECVSRTHACDRTSGAVCGNTVGSYVCTCPDGYVVDDSGLGCIESVLGFECEYADECDEGFVCAESEEMDYMTCQCPPGQAVSSDGLSCEEHTTEKSTPHIFTVQLQTEAPGDTQSVSAPDPLTHKATPMPSVEIKLPKAHISTSSLPTPSLPTSTPSLPTSTTILSASTQEPTVEATTQKPPTTSAPTTHPTASPTELTTTSAPTTHPTASPTELTTTSAPTTHPTASPTELTTTSVPTTHPTELTTTSPPTASPAELTTTSPPTASPAELTTTLPSTPSPTELTTTLSPTELTTTSAPTTPPTASPTELTATSAPTTPPTASPAELTTTAEPRCGGNMLEERGSFHSDNWPETYPVNVDCEWRIELPDPSKVIDISFDRSVFGLAGKMPACAKDWIKVYDGHSYHNTSWGPLCSFWKPKPFRTTSHKAMVVFHSGQRHNKSRKGFRLIFSSVDGPTTLPPLTTIPDNGPTTLPPLTTIPDVSTTSPDTEDELFTLPPPPKDVEGSFVCGIFVSPDMKFGTPGFPALYDSDTSSSCYWLFYKGDQKRYQLRILYFDLPMSVNCTKVNLKVYNGFNTVGEPLATLCGYLEPTQRIIRGTSIMKAVLSVSTSETLGFRGVHALFEETSVGNLNP